MLILEVVPKRRDRQTINVAQLAGVLGHEVGHVIDRHGAEHLAKQQLGSALINAVGIAAGRSPCRWQTGSYFGTSG